MLYALLQESNEEGFTLTELIIVVIIIGILSAIAVPMFLNNRIQAREATLKSDILAMADALDVWSAGSGETVDQIKPTMTSAGWSVLIKDNANFVTSGDYNFYKSGSALIPPDSYPSNFTPPTLSKGNAIGVFTSLYHAQTPGAYCILGNAENTKYDPVKMTKTGESGFKHALYYDSSSGGLKTAAELDSTGACSQYLQRIIDGT